jgi:hypothetical protein
MEECDRDFMIYFGADSSSNASATTLNSQQQRDASKPGGSVSSNDYTLSGSPTTASSNTHQSLAKSPSNSAVLVSKGPVDDTHQIISGRQIFMRNSAD